MKKTFLLFIAISFSLIAWSQEEMTLAEIKAEKAAIQSEISAKQADVNALQAKIDSWPGWRKGAIGILGFDLNGNSDWVRLDNPDSRSAGYGFNLIGYANKVEEKYFWNNTLSFNIKQTSSQLESDSESIKVTTDALDFASLYGKRLSEKWALSAELKYTSTLLNFNEPGKLLASAGVTWTPMSALVVNIHPLGYEKNWPGTLVSNPGAKIGATYANNAVIPGIAWTSSLNAFIPYGDGAADFDDNGMDDIVYSQGDLVNWTWVNGFSFTLLKGIGVGLGVGLSQDKQQADNWRFNNPDQVGLVEDANPLQFYYTLGLSYTL